MPFRYRLLFGVLFFVHTQVLLVAQSTKYFIEFTDKENSVYSLNRPLEFLSQRAIDRRNRQNIPLSIKDLPVNTSYLVSIKQTGAKIWYASRWMNGALIETDTITLKQLRQLPFVRTLSEQNRISRHNTAGGKTGLKAFQQKQTDVVDYGNSRNQNIMLGIDQMHAAGYTGKDIHIAMMDGGFSGANTMPVFETIFSEQRLLGTYDFVRNQPAVYDESRHGTNVWSVMAGYQPGLLVGPAYGASFWLFRTEEEDSEYRIEEINWLMAAEFADSVGVDIINTSLGYTTFDDPAMDYSPADMDGKTAFITRAANLAAATGMLVVVSAGNEGNDPWQTLSAPGDADSVLAVAAVDRSLLRASLSSYGKIIASTAIKPNVAAQGVGTIVMNPPNTLGASNGTSFSSPLVAGLAAGLWQAFPQLTNMQLLSYLQRSGSLATSPDTLLGYGIPSFAKAHQLIQKETNPEGSLGYLSPNPLITDALVFQANLSQLQQPLTLDFYDLQGRKLMSKIIAVPEAENHLTVPSGLFKPGMYMIKAFNANSSVTLRLIKL